jgi:hypothetical protein
MKLQTTLSLAVFALALGFGMSSPAAISTCDAQFKRCVADGHTPKAICLAEFIACRNGNP